MRLPCPWDSPGKNTGVGCHFLLQYMKVKVKGKSLSRVQPSATPWAAAYQASSVRGIFQARVLEWGAIDFFSANFLYPFLFSWDFYNDNVSVLDIVLEVS